MFPRLAYLFSTALIAAPAYAQDAGNEKEGQQTSSVDEVHGGANLIQCVVNGRLCVASLMFWAGTSIRHRATELVANIRPQIGDSLTQFSPAFPQHL